MSVNIYSYNPGSQSAASLAKELGILRLKHEGSRFKGRAGKTVINWGASKLPEEVMKCRIINEPKAIALVSNKLTFFKTVGGNNIPDFTEDMNEALKWIANGEVAVARKVLNGHSAEGLVIMENVDDAVKAPLYTKYVKKVDEYRVHVFKGKVLYVQKKVLSNERKAEAKDNPINWKVRNHGNGFIFQRQGIAPQEGITDVAIEYVNRAGLDFGAVDIIWSSHQKKPIVLEINTAPGLEGQSLIDYSKAFREELGL